MRNPPPAGSLDTFLTRCHEAMAPGGVVTDPDLTAAHAVDWTGRWAATTPAVLRPSTIEDVATIVALAREHRVALVPQGGNTGLVGGSVPHDGQVVVDLRRLDALGPIDHEAQQVTAGAGVTLAGLQAHAGAAGLAFGVDMGSRGSATIGGMVATNAGGIHVVRHGSMRSQVLGIEAVLGTGEVVRANLSGLVKDNTGYDLPGLLCGSEGTLGVVTAVRLRLLPVPAARLVGLLGFGSVRDATGALPVLRMLPSLRALELVLAHGLELVADLLASPVPLSPTPTCAVLLELAGPGDLVTELGPVLEALAVRSSAVADDDAGMRRLWRWREALPEAAATLGLVHKADVSLPHAELPSFVEEVGRVVDGVAPGATTLLYGHLGDGNVHVNIVGPHAGDEAPLAAVYELVLRHGGSISAEHGIGVAKRAWLERQRGSAAVGAMRAIKAALDPDRICNPGVLLTDPVAGGDGS